MITINPIADASALFRHYEGEDGPQPVHLEVDITDASVGCYYDAEIGGAVPESVQRRCVLRYRIPCLTAGAAHELMDEALPLVERIVAGATIERDRDGRQSGVLNGDAAAASGELDILCGEYADDDRQVTEVSAGEWFEAGGLVPITASTSDEQLNALAEQAAQEVRDQGAPGSLVLLVGAEAYLRQIRDTLVADLEEVQ